jgi:hypothetical protein
LDSNQVRTFSGRFSVGGLITPTYSTPRSASTVPLTPTWERSASRDLLTPATTPVRAVATVSVVIPLLKQPRDGEDGWTPARAPATSSTTVRRVIEPPLPKLARPEFSKQVVVSEVVSANALPVTPPSTTSLALVTAPAIAASTDNSTGSISQLTRKRRRVIRCDSEDDDLVIVEGTGYLFRRIIITSDS